MDDLKKSGFFFSILTIYFVNSEHYLFFSHFAILVQLKNISKHELHTLK